ncbi:nucleotide-binding universal stress UspA family protein [Streptomyces sp. B4I13]|uniref:universal stress protein n=1 Tax=Streptomyces sp. B4I13 TaxID=3042271 RepID=UPI0027801AE1|nr:universal stress protein [Streptomyces sp. B4I13]MDQ0958104.1 nucleotide-binding universal stress UspA family protein [Streptomyces sp. B4I13]
MVDKPLIVGVDGSGASLQALDWAVDEAAVRGVALRIVYASLWETYGGVQPSMWAGRPTLRAYADTIAASAAERAMRRTVAVKATADVLTEDAASALIRLSAEASAVVVGSRGRGELAGLLLGSVGLSVAAHAQSPVIVVRGAEKNVQRAFHRLLVGLDESEESQKPLEFALHEAELHGAPLTAVHAWRRPAREVPGYPDHRGDDEAHRFAAEHFMDRLLYPAALEHPGIDLRGQIMEGHGREALLDAASTVDLLVVGARRRKGHVGMQLGPVNHGVLHHSPCPVAVVPHG